MPEFPSPAIGNKSNTVTTEGDIPTNLMGRFTPWAAPRAGGQPISTRVAYASNTTDSSCHAPKSVPRTRLARNRRPGGSRPPPHWSKDYARLIELD